MVNPWAYNATVDEVRAAYAQGAKAVNFLREITPDSGAYIVGDLSFFVSCSKFLNCPRYSRTNRIFMNPTMKVYSISHAHLTIFNQTRC